MRKKEEPKEDLAGLLEGFRIWETEARAGYSLSVVVYSIPEEGFEYMHRLADSQDPDILWIMKQNLKKKRLTRNFLGEVASIRKR